MPRTSGDQQIPDTPRELAEGATTVLTDDSADPHAAAVRAMSTQAADPEKVKAALSDAAQMTRNLWIAFLSFSTYVLIAVGAVTHRQLLLEAPIALPLLNINLPLVGFFFVVPILLLIFHVHLVLHLKLMADKVRRYVVLVSGLKLESSVEQGIMLQLPNSEFVQFLVGPHGRRKSLTDWLMIVIIWITVVVGPLALLLLIQLQFLPYHLEWVTLTHRLIFVLDLCVLWSLWPDIANRKGFGRWTVVAVRTVAACLSIGLIVFSVFIAAFPGEDLYKNPVATLISITVPKKWSYAGNPERDQASITEYLFEEQVNSEKGRPSWLSNRLVLSDQVFVDGETIEKIKAKQEKEGKRPSESERARSFRGRDLRGAVLVRADLRRIDFAGAHLEGADLRGASLEGALFGCRPASEHRVDPLEDCAWLDGANFEGAELQGASLHGAQALRTNFSWADLRGALLTKAKLRGADLSWAQLQGASLNDAELQDAALTKARLQGASLNNAKLQGATLSGAKLQSASLLYAELQGANLSLARLHGASLDGAKLQAASLSSSFLIGASLKSADLKGARVLGAQLQGALLEAADFQGANLERVSVWRSSRNAQTIFTLAQIDARTDAVLPQMGDIDLEHDLQPVNSSHVEKLIRDELDDVVDESTRVRIRKQLAVLRPAAWPKSRDDQNAKHWKPQEAKLRKPQEENQLELASFFKKLGCTDLYIARGLIERISEVGSHAPDIQRAFLDRKNCPALAGLTDKDRQRLQDASKQNEP